MCTGMFYKKNSTLHKKMKSSIEIEDSIIKSIEKNNATELEKIIKSGYDFNKKLSQKRLRIPQPFLINPSNPTPLGFAVENNAVDCIKLLLALPGININKADAGRNKVTPLYTAAERGYAECVKLLLNAKGINVNKAARGKESPLLAAAKCGQAECLQLLLKAPDINVNKKARYRYNFYNREIALIRPTALDMAIYQNASECIQALLAHPKINTKHIPSTILAVLKNKPQELKSLIAAGANVNQRDRRGYTALHHAACLNNTACVDILLQTPDISPDTMTKEGDTAIELAAERGCTECLKHLLASPKVKRDADVLYLAAVNNEPDCEELLLRDKQIAASYSPAQLAVCHNDVAALRKAINDGTDVNATFDSKWKTLLHQAACYNWTHDCLQLLLNEAKINPNSTDKSGLTPLHYAALNNAPDNVKALLEHPATELNKAAHDGFTPLDACGDNTQCRAILKRHGAQGRKWHYQFTRPWSVCCIWMGAALGLLGTCHYNEKYDSLSQAMVREEVTEGETALMRAAEEGRSKNVKVLIDAGADVNVKDKNGETALMKAEQKKHTEIIEQLKAAGAK